MNSRKRTFPRRVYGLNALSLLAIPAVASFAEYTWRPVPGALSVRVSGDTIHRIDGEVRQAYLAAHKCGTEVCGTLLGRSSMVHGRLTIWLQAAEPQLLNGDSDLLALVAQRREGSTPVGFYRSHNRDDLTGSELTLETGDVELLNALGPGTFLFLLLRPLGVSRVLANLYVCEDGRITHQTEFVPFPFDGRPFEFAPDCRAVQIGDAAGTKRPARRWTWLLVPAFVGLVTGSGLIAYSVKERKPAPPTPAPLELSAHTAPGQIAFEWNRKMPRTVRGGVTIEDGEADRRFELDTGQVRAGRLLYIPRSAAVRMQLEAVDGEGGVRRESIVVLDAVPDEVAPESSHGAPSRNATRRHRTVAGPQFHPRLLPPPRNPSRFRRAMGKTGRAASRLWPFKKSSETR